MENDNTDNDVNNNNNNNGMYKTSYTQCSCSPSLSRYPPTPQEVVPPARFPQNEYWAWHCKVSNIS